jgi:hypothetical protein
MVDEGAFFKPEAVRKIDVGHAQRIFSLEQAGAAARSTCRFFLDSA